jgi:hypothetical protein
LPLFDKYNSVTIVFCYAVGGDAGADQSLAAEAGADRALREAAQQQKEKGAVAGKKEAKPAAKKQEGKKKAAKAEKKKAKKAGDKKKGKKAGAAKKQSGKKAAKKAGGKKAKKAEKKKAKKGKKAGGKKSAKKGGKSAKKGGKSAKKGGKSAKKAGGKKGKKAGGNKAVKSVARQSTSCATDSTCLLNAGKYYQQVVVKGVNYKNQYTRINTFLKQSTSKGGKKDDFAPTLNNMKELGGGNASALACGGSTSGTGASTLNSVVTSLNKCSANIKDACMGAPPSINDTQAQVCLAAIGNLTAGVANCSSLNGTAACDCWKDAKLATLSATVATCDLANTNKNATTFKSSCQKSYTDCKNISNTGPNLISACSSNVGSLTGKLKTATDNQNALAELKTTIDKLVASAGSSGKRQALSCKDFAGQVSDVSKKAQNAPGDSSIADAAKSAVAKAPTSCASSDLTLLQAAANVLVQAVAFVASLIDSIQANLQSKFMYNSFLTLLKIGVNVLQVFWTHI